MRLGNPGATGDLTARARIRQAAVDCIVDEGFTTSVRTIARRADVSGGLIEYHYGSKAGLFDACDAFVTDQIAAVKEKRIADAADGPSPQLFQTLIDPEYAWLLGYLIRALQTGGPRATAMYERLVADNRRQFELSDRTGLVSPSRDPEARVRWATATSVGSLMVLAALHPDDDPTALMQRFIDEFMFPALEAYTEPLLADRTYLDLYLQTQDTGSPSTKEHA